MKTVIWFAATPKQKEVCGSSRLCPLAILLCSALWQQGRDWAEVWLGSSLLSQLVPNPKRLCPVALERCWHPAAELAFPLTKGMVNKVRMCQMYNTIKTYYSLSKCSYSVWEHCTLACLIDPSIDRMLALQKTVWPEAIDQPLEKAVEWSLPSLI